MAKPSSRKVDIVERMIEKVKSLIDSGQPPISRELLSLVLQRTSMATILNSRSYAVSHLMNRSLYVPLLSTMDAGFISYKAADATENTPSAGSISHRLHPPGNIVSQESLIEHVSAFVARKQPLLSDSTLVTWVIKEYDAMIMESLNSTDLADILLMGALKRKTIPASDGKPERSSLYFRASVHFLKQTHLAV